MCVRKRPLAPIIEALDGSTGGSRVQVRRRVRSRGGGRSMPNFKLGCKGLEVARIQPRLQSLGFYRGPLDGIFGGGTDAAIRAFQREKSVGVDGIVGPKTWKLLFPRLPVPRPAILDQPLHHRCLALTAVF